MNMILAGAVILVFAATSWVSAQVTRGNPQAAHLGTSLTQGVA